MKHIKEIMEALIKKFPDLNLTTLNGMRKKPNPFKILISCLLSLRTQDKNTKIASERLFAVADTPKKIINLQDKELEELIFSSGHYKKKSRVLKHVSNEILTKFNNKVPDTKEQLLSIKGVGPKTANIVLAFAFNQYALPIDTHCHRIPNRIGWITTKTPEQTEKELEKKLPKTYWKEFNHVFVQFGQTICKPISPKCSECPINKYCKKIKVERFR